jgi:hypothetical protein
VSAPHQDEEDCQEINIFGDVKLNRDNPFIETVIHEASEASDNSNAATSIGFFPSFETVIHERDDSNASTSIDASYRFPSFASGRTFDELELSRQLSESAQLLFSPLQAHAHAHAFEFEGSLGVVATPLANKSSLASLFSSSTSPLQVDAAPASSREDDEVFNQLVKSLSAVACGGTAAVDGLSEPGSFMPLRLIYFIHNVARCARSADVKC